MLYVPEVERLGATVQDELAPIATAGKFFRKGQMPFFIRGVTYGTFAPDANGDMFPSPARVLLDFRAIAASGFNAVRVYTTPPAWILDIAAECRLRLLIGLTWEQHVAFLESVTCARDIRNRVRNQVAGCRGHKAVLGFTIGNEIPASIVRWHGRKRIEGFLHDLFDIAKSASPDALATYVNFPTTAYLELPFLDFVAFNVYLEKEEKLSAYLKRLQNIAADVPLVLAEVGLDSRRNGELNQADSLEWQIRTAFQEGCAGTFVYAWTDEWYRGGQPIEDWDFGLTTRSREPKAALQAVRSVMVEVPFKRQRQWPKISVVVCSYNGAATIRDTLEHVTRLDYPNYETIVVNDGSTDATPDIAKEYGVLLIGTPNQGLGKARNEGLSAATGEIIVYIDDDAYPPPPWLKYLAYAFLRSEHACIGGPNFVPPEDGWVGQCVADSPGGPLHVLLTDEVAEHVPGCNMAFRRTRLAAIGGFDPMFRAAGDDVDVCWRLQDQGWTIGFSAAAMVWHHRRATVRRYWRQQVGYGKAEALLERKWPGRFSALGHLAWSGRIYGRGLPRLLFGTRPRVYQGTWGLAPYQGLYQPPPNHLLSLALTPEWLFLAAAMLAIGAFGLLARPLGWSAALAAAMVAVSLGQALRGAMEARHLLRARNLSAFAKMRSFALIALLHMMQPAARLWGRIKHGLTPGRRRHPISAQRASAPKTIWSETWRSPDDWLRDLEAELKHRSAVVTRGGTYDEWDLSVRGGLFANAHLTMAVEDHEFGKQNLRFRTTIRPSGFFTGLAVPIAIIGLAALLAHSLPAALTGAVLATVLGWQAKRDWESAAHRIALALQAMRQRASQALLESDGSRGDDRDEPWPARAAE